MEKIVDFKIIAKENENITLTGCVDINTIDDDEPDFEYANSQEFYTPQRYWDIQAETSWKLDEEEQMIRENICNKVDADVCGDIVKMPNVYGISRMKTKPSKEAVTISSLMRVHNLK